MWKSQFNFGFMNKLMLKDLDIIIKEINQSDIQLPVTKIIKVVEYFKTMSTDK